MNKQHEVNISVWCRTVFRIIEDGSRLIASSIHSSLHETLGSGFTMYLADYHTSLQNGRIYPAGRNTFQLSECVRWSRYADLCGCEVKTKKQSNIFNLSGFELTGCQCCVSFLMSCTFLRYSIEPNHLLKIPVDYSELINQASMFT